MKRPDEIRAGQERRKRKERELRAERRAAGHPHEWWHHREDAPSESGPMLEAPSRRVAAPDAVPHEVVSADGGHPQASATDTEESDIRVDAARAHIPRAREARAELRAALRRQRTYQRRQSRRFTQDARRRRVIALSALGSVLVVSIIVLVLAFTPLLAVSTVRVEGVKRLDRAAIEKALTTEVGTPLPQVDGSSLMKVLKPFTGIQSFSFRAELPATLVVTVVERAPVVTVREAGKYHVVDAAGMTLWTSAKRPGSYPLVSVDRPGDAGFVAALDVLRVLPQSVRSKIERVSAKTRDDVTLRLRNGVDVLWGDSHDQDLKATVLETLLKVHPGAKTIDVSAPDAPVVS